MKETIDLLGKILTNILTALYEPFGFSFLLSFLAMFFYLYAYKQACGVRPHKEISVEEFKEITQKRIIIANCCRKEWYPVSEINEGYIAYIEKSYSQFNNTREIYEKLVRKMDVMNIVMYGCDIGETSGDDSRKGGYYTQSLMLRLS